MKKYNDVLFYKIVRPIITVIFKIFFTPKIYGKENINKSGKVILAGNHTSNLDCLLLISTTKRSIHFLAKKELWKGFKKVIFSNLGLIPVDRKNKDHKALTDAIEYLNNDKLIGIFPEGTTEKEGVMLPFKMGVIKMANVTKSPIIPFAITGKYRLFSRDLKIVFGKPLYVDSNNFEEEKHRLEKCIQNLIRGD